MPNKSLPSLNALRVFAVVARAKSFKQAASELEVTQSAISRQIQTLEEQLGLRLLQRDNRVHALTPAGELIAPELQRMFSQLETLLERSQRIGSTDSGLVRIGLSNELLRWWLAPRLHEFKALYPNIELRFHALPEYMTGQNAGRVQEMLLHDQVDIALYLGRLSDKQIQQQVAADTVLTPIAAKQHQLTSDNWGQQQRLAIKGANDWPQWQQLFSDQLNAQRIATIDNTAMALTMAEIQPQWLLVPHWYQGLLADNNWQIAEDWRCNSQLSLSIGLAKRRAHELRLVAVANWLAHIAEHTNS